MHRTCSLLILAAGMVLGASARPAAADGEIRTYFEGIDAGGEALAGGEPLYDAALLAAFYNARDHQPLWTSGGPLVSSVDELVGAITDSTAHGFNGADYHLSALDALRQRPRSAGSLALELLASDAFLRQVRHRAMGVVSPHELDPDWHLIEPEVDAGRTLERVAGAPSTLRSTLDALWPHSEEYRLLVAHRARLLGMADDHTVPVPPGPLLKLGYAGQRVRALAERLLGPGEHGDVYDENLRGAVIAFQRAAGLEPDGIVGEASLEVMNATRFSWIDRIDANLERWRWLPRDVPPTYVRVNIAAFRLRVIDEGRDDLTMDVIVGRPYRRTPVFTESIKYIVFNPYWNVPRKLAIQDKLPLLKTDPAALEAQGFEARAAESDEFRAVTSIDWSDVRAANFHYLLRQRPGPMNALGAIKFMLPNPYDVYLHDTSNRELFSKTERGFSSGCIRLSRPLELAGWIFEREGRRESPADTVAGGKTVTVYLKRPLPAYIVYFTAFTDGDEDVVFRRDIYQRDAPLVAALRGDGS